jgi:predicted nucleic acid-binding Zn ribbon protein
MTRCPLCAEAIPDDAIRCRYCGASMTSPDRTKRTFLVTLALVLAALLIAGWTALRLYPKAGPVVTGNKAHDALMKLPISAREAAFERVLLGRPCGAVVATFYQGVSPTADAFWSVRCGTGRGYQIMVKNDSGGSITVQDCDAVRAAGAGECFQPLAQH